MGDKEQEIFLGREFAQRREISRAHRADGGRRGQAAGGRGVRARHGIITENRELLDRIAAALLERETIDREDLDRLVKNLPLPPRSMPPADSPAAQASPVTKPGASPARAPIFWARPGRTRGRVNVTPLALHSPRAVRDALRAHGWDEGQAARRRRRQPSIAFH